MASGGFFGAVGSSGSGSGPTRSANSPATPFWVAMATIWCFSSCSPRSSSRVIYSKFRFLTSIKAEARFAERCRVVLKVDMHRVETARRRNHRDVRGAHLVDPHAQHQFVGFSIFLARFSPICVGIAFLPWRQTGAAALRCRIRLCAQQPRSPNSPAACASPAAGSGPIGELPRTRPVSSGPLQLRAPGHCRRARPAPPRSGSTPDPARQCRASQKLS